MKLEALILRVLCAASMLVCVLVLGTMLLARPAPMPATRILAGAMQSTTSSPGPVEHAAVAKPQRS